jgi:hypothetical protein
MTIEQILTEIYKNGYTDEIFLALSRRVINEKEKMNKQIAEDKATLRIISKITEDKTIKEILEE